MKNIEFPKPTYQDWKEQAIKALKGKPFESLFTNTLEGITLQPLYTQETLIEKLGNQLDKQISAIRTLKAIDDFAVSQQIFGETASEFFNNLQDSLNKGNQIITIDSRTIEWNEDTLTQLASYITENSFKLIIQNSDDPILNVFHKIDVGKRSDVKGYIVSSTPIELQQYPNVRTYCANTILYHYDGANIIQELSIALAYAAKFASKENHFETFLNKFFVNFAIDTQFFQEIAKLRAFKVLWKAFCKAYNVEGKPVPIVCETSLRSFSKYDIYVNMLRAGNEAFSALIGGADVFTVHPYDCLTKPTEKSIRIARNTILVLKEESFVAKTVDPSAGSYFIETLTREYVEKAWEKFLQIEEAGGIDAFIQSGQLQNELNDMYKARMEAVETRKHSLIGTNIYANPQDEIPKETNRLFTNVKRLAIEFENLREKFSTIESKIGLLTFGKLKEFKPRADFVTGVFATAGINVEQSGEITSIDKAKEWLTNCNYLYVIVCAKDEDSKVLVPLLLKEKNEQIMLDVAGKFNEVEDEWKKCGLNGSIYLGQNIVEKLNEVYNFLKEVQQ